MARARLLAVVALTAVVASACGTNHSRAIASAPTTSTTVVHRARPVKTKPRPAVAPLTGLPDPFDVTAHRCAVTVKIDNTPAAQPHYGLEQADVVYEEVVEGGITRLAAVFNSQAPDRVGPVRSVRRTDQSLVWPLRGVFAYSGGAAYAIASIDTAPVVQLDETRAGSMMFRDDTRSAPHNLYAHVDQMYARCASPPPPALFTYRQPQASAAGAVVGSVRVGFMQGYAVTWTWDSYSGSWRRSLFGRPEITAAGEPLEATNVVVMSTNYVGGVGVEGAEANLVGRGTAWVFSAGREVTGTWVRPDKTKPARLFDSQHRIVPLSPGPTWVELPDASYQVFATP
jgi:hypothetical protein